MLLSVKGFAQHHFIKSGKVFQKDCHCLLVFLVGWTAQKYGWKHCAESKWIQRGAHQMVYGETVVMLEKRTVLSIIGHLKHGREIVTTLGTHVEASRFALKTCKGSLEVGHGA